MKNIFIRGRLAPYRIDFYNALSNNLKMDFFFYRPRELSQEYNLDKLEKLCDFEPHYLKCYEIGGNSRKLCNGIYKILKSNKPNLVIVPEFKVFLIQVWIFRLFLKRKFKIISLCDDSFDMISNNNDFTLIHKFARKILTPLLDDLILVEPRVMEWYQEKYKKGIWFPIIRDENKEREDYTRVLPLSNELNTKFNLEGKKVILYVGRLIALKNLSRFLSAVEKLDEDCVVVIIGSGEEEKLLKQQAEKIKKEIIFIGWLEGDELRAWYNVSDVFVLLSTQEAFGAVTNEALLAGNYVVVSEKAGSNCLVVENVNGHIVDPYDVDMISLYIDKFLSKIVKTNNDITLKPNLMKVSFHERMNNLIDKL